MNQPATILLVDDLAANRETLCELLGAQDYQLVEAADGPAALRLAAEAPPDLVLLDVMMPGMDGFEVCRRLRADARLAEVPVIMVTALDDQASRLAGIEAGADDFITKPFQSAELRARVRTITRLNRYRRLTEMQAALRESEARFSQLAELSDDAFRFATVNPERVVYASPAVAVIWGRPLASFLEYPRQWEQGIHPDEAPRVHAAYEAMLAGRTDHFVEEYRVVRPDGTERWVLDSSTPVRAGSAAIVSIGGVARDITARKQAELERHDLLVELQQAKRLEAIGQLAAGIAHEINTPLQFVTDNTHFLTKTFARLARAREAEHDSPGSSVEPEAGLALLRAEIPQVLQQNLEGLGQVARIVQSLKELTHPQNARFIAADLNHVIATAVTVSRHEWKYVAEVFMDFAPDLPPVPCVVDDFNQVILNLLVNAAQAIRSAHRDRPTTAGKGTITVRTRVDGTWALVEIEDTGTGIPAEILPRIFEPFFTTKELGKGTGQGLALVQTVIVKKHRGMIHVTTHVGCGTIFHLRLPLRAPAQFSLP